MPVLTNPEVIRNVRAQLRVERMAIAAAICAVLSLATGYSKYHQSLTFAGYASSRWGLDFLGLVVGAQVAVLVFGGGLAGLMSIQREKEQNTFDYQRVTRLTPFELATGKLLGAPALMYFIALCLLPAAAVGAFAGHADLTFVLAGYAIMILGAVCIHALALLLSLFVDRGASPVGVVVILLFFWVSPILHVSGALHLGSLSPFVASTIVTQTSWAVDPTAARDRSLVFSTRSQMTDVLFGWPVHHVYVLAVIYLVFTAWFLLAVVRNIKRDPAVYEVFTPPQALGFALWINFIALAFFPWRRSAPLLTHETFLGLNVAVFYTLGIALLRSRDRTRRLRAAGARVPAWLSLWPAPYVAAGLLLGGLVPVAVLQAIRTPDAPWDLGLGVFRAAFVAAWICRDVLFLQWMNLQRGGRPVRRGILYLAVFYICAAVVLTTLHVWFLDDPGGNATAAMFVPALVMGLGVEFWSAAWPLWLVGLGGQVAVAGLFVVLQRSKLTELSAPVEVAPAAAAGSL